MSRFPYIVLGVVLSAVVLAGALEPVAVPAPVSAGGSGASELATLRTQALTQLSAGEFTDGADTLARLLELAPEDATVRQADQWLSAYLDRRGEDQAERQAEYELAAARAQTLLRVAQDWEQTQPRVVAGRPAANKAQSTYIGLYAALAPGLQESGQPTNLRERVAEDTQTIIESINTAAQALSGLTHRWAQDIRAVAAEAVAAVEAFGAQAGELPWETLDDRRDSRRALQDANDRVEDALTTLAVLMADNPWRGALDQARLAKESATDVQAFLQSDWVGEVRSAAQARAAQRHQEDEWFDALALYSGLAALQDDKQAYRDQINQISQHVRVRALYVPRDESAADDNADDDTDEPVGTLDEDDEEIGESLLATRDWRQMVVGIDGTMVRQIIGQISQSYVSSVDFRDVLIGGLQAVRVLADTPEVGQTFPGLRDESARQTFLAGLDAQIAEAHARSAVQNVYVESALNRLSDANRRTVGIPDEVIYLEFTEGMLRRLDEFSSMIWPADWPDFMKQTMGRFYGVGIQIQLEDGLLKVVSPLEDSPAYAAGIQAGDYIVAIDGRNARNLPLDQAVKSITGPKGTQVVLTINRPGLAEPFDVPLVRDEIHVQTVKGWKRYDDGHWDWMLDSEARIGYIRLTSFTGDTPEELRKALSELEEAGVRGLILDLRFNPGGYLGAATQVADEFLRRGLLVSTKGRQQTSRGSSATPTGAYLDGEVVVLVNGMSASAAEIVSGALKDWQRATVVGTRSFGKGSVQNLIQVRPEQAYLKLTTAYYYLPLGRCLHRTDESPTWGVEPDVEVTLTPRQRRRWLELRRDSEIIQQRDAERHAREMAEQFRADIQLDSALMLLRVRLLEDEAPASRPAVQTAGKAG